MSGLRAALADLVNADGWGWNHRAYGSLNPDQIIGAHVDHGGDWVAVRIAIHGGEEIVNLPAMLVWNLVLAELLRPGVTWA